MYPEHNRFDHVSNLDYQLYQLAMYEVTKGRMMVLESTEDSLKLKKRTAAKFNYFKRLIQNGDCTYKYIEDTVLDKNGPFLQEGAKLSDEERFEQGLEKLMDDKEDKSSQSLGNEPLGLYEITYFSQVLKVLMEKMTEADRILFLKMSGICDTCIIAKEKEDAYDELMESDPLPLDELDDWIDEGETESDEPQSE